MIAKVHFCWCLDYRVNCGTDDNRNVGDQTAVRPNYPCIPRT